MLLGATRAPGRNTSSQEQHKLPGATRAQLPGATRAPGSNTTKREYLHLKGVSWKTCKLAIARTLVDISESVVYNRVLNQGNEDVKGLELC